MSALLRVFLDIALLRSGPQVLPASSLLLVLAAALDAATFVAVATAAAIGLRMAATLLVAGLAIDVIGFGLVLSIAGRPQRYLQTLTASFGASAVIGLALLPFALLVAVGGERFALVGAIAGLLARGWSLAVVANLLRHALEVLWPLAFALAAAYLFVNLLAQSALGAA